MHSTYLSGLESIILRGGEARQIRDVCVQYIDICASERAIDDKCYRYAKLMLDKEIENSTGGSYGYDVVRIEDLLAVLAAFPREQVISLLGYFLRGLENAGRAFERSIVADRLLELRSLRDLVSFQPPRLIRGGINWISVRVWRLIVFFVFVYFLIAVMTMTAVFPQFECFEVKFNKYSSSLTLNHLLNVAMFCVSGDDDIKILPINALGVVVLTVGKILSILIIVNFLFRSLLERLTPR